MKPDRSYNANNNGKLFWEVIGRSMGWISDRCTENEENEKVVLNPVKKVVSNPGKLLFRLLKCKFTF